MIIKRGDLLLADFNPVKGSEQGKTRPCVVIQNNVGNAYSNTTIVVPVTSKISEKFYPTDVFATAEDLNLKSDGTINCSQIATVSVKDRIIKKLGSLKPSTMKKVDDKDYGTVVHMYNFQKKEYCRQLVEVKIRQAITSGDLYVFVPWGETEFGTPISKKFSIKWHEDEEKYYFIDKSGDFILHSYCFTNINFI